jgi:8-hydroxy-5-deazaflavin:NADPH oxidoreductase
MEIGTIGAGDFAQAFAKRALKAGHKVKLSNSRGPDSLREIVNQLGLGATAATKEEASACEIVLLAVPRGQRARHTCKSSQVEQSDSDRWDQSLSR